MMSLDYNRSLYLRHIQAADVAVVEGVMGLFDGFSGGDESGSTAEMAKELNIPVVLVIDAHAMARSAAAIAIGYSSFDPNISIKGVIFNRVASKGHGEILMEAMRFPNPVLSFGSRHG